MFNFFRKKQENPFSEFASTYSKEQKASIIGIMLMLGKSAGNINKQQMDAISNTAKMLNLDIDDPILISAAAGGHDYLVNNLKTLDQSQKDFFVVTINGYCLTGGENIEKLFNYSLKFCEKIGISEIEYESIIKKMALMMEKFG
jgi:hypothetical protein